MCKDDDKVNYEDGDGNNKVVLASLYGTFNTPFLGFVESKPEDWLYRKYIKLKRRGLYSLLFFTNITLT